MHHVFVSVFVIIPSATKHQRARRQSSGGDEFDNKVMEDEVTGIS
jgi:hypothetical protein